jgi:hypothetical protein
MRKLQFREYLKHTAHFPISTRRVLVNPRRSQGEYGAPLMIKRGLIRKAG